MNRPLHRHGGARHAEREASEAAALGSTLHQRQQMISALAQTSPSVLERIRSRAPSRLNADRSQASDKPLSVHQGSPQGDTGVRPLLDEDPVVLSDALGQVGQQRVVAAAQATLVTGGAGKGKVGELTVHAHANNLEG